jgi:two-component system, OmpR family, phosphate regulon response regulator PhoB
VTAALTAAGSTILLVDDERPVREMLALALEDTGFSVLQAFHGRHALQVIAQHRPDLVISDVMMPLIGGIELCRRLKSDPETAAIPVVLMSAAGAQAGRGAGADAVVAKPFDLEEMDTLGHRLLASAPSTTSATPAEA